MDKHKAGCSHEESDGRDVSNEKSSCKALKPRDLKNRIKEIVKTTLPITVH